MCDYKKALYNLIGQVAEVVDLLAEALQTVENEVLMVDNQSEEKEKQCFFLQLVKNEKKDTE